MLPQTLTMEGRTYPAAYLYAVATREDCRGRGLAGTLLQFTEALLERLGYRCAVLVPAEQPLFGFYARLGYEPVFLRSRTPFPGGREISQAEYHRRREALLTGPHMTYGPELYAYLQSAYGVRFYETDTGIAAAGDGYTAEVLPEIVSALHGSSTKILVDGGIRTGTDIFKALALGADAAVIARPFVTAVYGGGEEGVRLYIEKLAGELADAMQMCGARTLADITPEMVRICK